MKHGTLGILLFSLASTALTLHADTLILRNGKTVGDVFRRKYPANRVPALIR
jgi:hypothetical protein